MHDDRAGPGAANARHRRNVAPAGLLSQIARHVQRSQRRARYQCPTSSALCTTSRADISAGPLTTWGVPTRPSQTDPKRAKIWERRRRAVGARIRALRRDRDMTQEALALASGLARNVLIDVEHGRRGLLYERLFDLADALGVSAAELLDE
jgi:DNA-binding XRE family transcriptional regulator